MKRRASLEVAILFGPAVLLFVLVLAVPLGFIVFTSVHGLSFSFDSYRELIGSRLFQRALWNTVEVSVICSVVSVLLGYPVALHLARQSARQRALTMVMVLMPLWTSVLVKSFSFAILLGRGGLVNAALSWAWGERVALPLMFNRLGVVLGMTNYLIPFVVLPITASLLAIDPALRRAAEIMGARPPRIFLSIVLPLSVPGIVAALSTTTVMSLGIFVVPALLGGRQDMMMANLVDFYTRETLDWAAASAIGMILLAVVAVVGLPAMRLQRDAATG